MSSSRPRNSRERYNAPTTGRWTHDDAECQREHRGYCEEVTHEGFIEKLIDTAECGGAVYGVALVNPAASLVVAIDCGAFQDTEG